jgi:hypothetical protein
MLEGRGGPQGRENRDFKKIDPLANEIHEMGNSPSSKFGEVRVATGNGDQAGEIVYNGKSSTLPESERYRISRTGTRDGSFVADEVFVGQDGTFHHEDYTEEIRRIRGYVDSGVRVEVDDKEADELRTDFTNIFGKESTGRTTDRTVHGYMGEVRADLGARWPQDVDLPEDSSGDVDPTEQSRERFGAVAEHLAQDSETKVQKWGTKGNMYTLTSESKGGTVTNHSLALEQQAGEDEGVPIKRSTDWAFPRTGTSTSLAFTDVDQDAYRDADVEQQMHADDIRAGTFRFMDDIAVNGRPAAHPTQTERAREILESRKDALAPEEE